MFGVNAQRMSSNRGAAALRKLGHRVCLVAAIVVLPACPPIRFYGEIQGQVLDRSGVPIEGAVVVLYWDLVQEPLVRFTGEDGEYSYTSLGPTSYTIDVYAWGFVAERVAVELEPDEVFRLDFELEEQPQ